MLRKKLKWQLLFENKNQLDELFQSKQSVIHKNMFGEILLVKSNEDYYAFKNKCPHQNKSLENCKVSEGNIVCPWHQYQFSCDTGRGHSLHIDKYPLKFENEAVYIGKEVWTFFGKD